MTTKSDEYFHGATRNDPDPATVELRFRPRPQSNTFHPDKFKPIVALSSRFQNHDDPSRIIMVLLRFMPVHHDCATKNHADASRFEVAG